MVVVQKLQIQLDDVLTPLLTGDPRRDLTRFFQHAYTLTALDPRPFAPPLESTKDRVDNLRFLCQVHKMSASGWRQLESNGFRSLSHVGLITPTQVDRLQLSPEDQKALAKIQIHLKQTQPLEPLYSFKQYWASLKSRKSVAKNASLEYLDLASLAQPLLTGPKVKDPNSGPTRWQLKYSHKHDPQSPLVSTTLAFPASPSRATATMSALKKPNLQVTAQKFVPKARSGVVPGTAYKSVPNKSRSEVGQGTAKGRGQGQRHANPVSRQTMKLTCEQCSDTFTFRGIPYQYCSKCWNQSRNHGPNAMKGCQVILPYRKFHHHSNPCRYDPFYCPFFGCHYSFSDCSTLTKHLALAHDYQREVVVPHLFPSPNYQVSQEAHLYMVASGQDLVLDPKYCPPFWVDPPEFQLDGITFFIILCRRNALAYIQQDDHSVRYFFWIYALTNDETASRYHFEISILGHPRGLLWGRGRAQSVQRPYGLITKRNKGLEQTEIVSFDQRRLRQALDHDKLKYQMKICKI